MLEKTQKSALRTGNLKFPTPMRKNPKGRGPDLERESAESPHDATSVPVTSSFPSARADQKPTVRERLYSPPCSSVTCDAIPPGTVRTIPEAAAGALRLLGFPLKVPEPEKPGRRGSPSSFVWCRPLASGGSGGRRERPFFLPLPSHLPPTPAASGFSLRVSRRLK